MAVNPADRGCTQPSQAAFLGRDEEWVRWNSAAWRSLADPDGEYPRWSARLRETAGHIEQAAAVVSVLELAIFGLGWRRPDIGLAAWIELGRPTDHPILALFDDWWGEDIALITTWAGHPDCSAFYHLDKQVTEACGLPSQPFQQLRRNTTLEEHPWIQKHCLGGSDPFHSSLHAAVPVLPDFLGGRSTEPPRWIIDSTSNPATATIITSQYPGWYADLVHGGETLPATTRSWRVDVIVRPFGWLGQYRKSRRTGMWFTGQHRWHLLGYP
ncbi:hypothetical protein [Flexivirga oryzae]|uniref:Uncharacterized protein n=1 Tax=Flexivirga oryzae TaxID=1794944 RepID=A0A839N9H5_9MICO|nr:hypothetical protein [Flexivirga oryzae]MBB2893469.1 hypothetical protein [Flexivirga oryzae]